MFSVVVLRRMKHNAGKDGNNKLKIVNNKPVLSEVEWIEKAQSQNFNNRASRIEHQESSIKNRASKIEHQESSIENYAKQTQFYPHRTYAHNAKRATGHESRKKYAKRTQFAKQRA